MIITSIIPGTVSPSRLQPFDAAGHNVVVEIPDLPGDHWWVLVQPSNKRRYLARVVLDIWGGPSTGGDLRLCLARPAKAHDNPTPPEYLKLETSLRHPWITKAPTGEEAAADWERHPLLWTALAPDQPLEWEEGLALALYWHTDGAFGPATVGIDYYQ